MTINDMLEIMQKIKELYPRKDVTDSPTIWGMRKAQYDGHEVLIFELCDGYTFVSESLKKTKKITYALVEIFLVTGDHRFNYAIYIMSEDDFHNSEYGNL